jgi:hypothetical protein
LSELLLACEKRQESVKIHAKIPRRCPTLEFRHLRGDMGSDHHFLRQRNAGDGLEEGPEHLCVVKSGHGDCRHHRIRRQRRHPIEKGVHLSNTEAVGSNLIAIERRDLAFGLRVIGRCERLRLLDMPAVLTENSIRTGLSSERR